MLSRLTGMDRSRESLLTLSFLKGHENWGKPQLEKKKLLSVEQSLNSVATQPRQSGRLMKRGLRPRQVSGRRPCGVARWPSCGEEPSRVRPSRCGPGSLVKANIADPVEAVFD